MHIKNKTYCFTFGGKKLKMTRNFDIITHIIERFRGKMSFDLLYYTITFLTLYIIRIPLIAF
jgi:hypothetical protein